METEMMMDMKNSVSQIKASVEGLPNRMNHVENRAGRQSRGIDHSPINEKSKKQKSQWEMGELWDTMKRHILEIMDIEEGEEYDSKDVQNIFNKIIENSQT